MIDVGSDVCIQLQAKECKSASSWLLWGSSGGMSSVGYVFRLQQ